MRGVMIDVSNDEALACAKIERSLAAQHRTSHTAQQVIGYGSQPLARIAHPVGEAGAISQRDVLAGIPADCDHIHVLQRKPSVAEAKINRLVGKRIVMLDSREPLLRCAGHHTAIDDKRGGGNRAGMMDAKNFQSLPDCWHGDGKQSEHDLIVDLNVRLAHGQ